MWIVVSFTIYLLVFDFVFNSPDFRVHHLEFSKYSRNHHQVHSRVWSYQRNPNKSPSHLCHEPNLGECQMATFLTLPPPTLPLCHLVQTMAKQSWLSLPQLCPSLPVWTCSGFSDFRNEEIYATQFLEDFRLKKGFCSSIVVKVSSTTVFCRW